MSKTRSYPSDLTDDQWEIMRRLLPKRKTKVGHPVTVERRDLVEAILYILRTGCQWRLLPHDFPPWGTVSSQYYRWRRAGVWQGIEATLYPRVRQEAGRNARPTAGIIDSQTVKTTEAGGPRGYDGGKKINGRKRHIVVDTLGLLLAVVVHAANIQDYVGAKLVLEKAKARFRTLKRIYADGIYKLGSLPSWALFMCKVVLEVVEKAPNLVGFHVVKHRWKVERTFAWLGRNRRLSRDYERTTTSSETWIHIANVKLLLNRLKYT
jgi:putative transposase